MHNFPIDANFSVDSWSVPRTTTTTSRRGRPGLMPRITIKIKVKKKQQNSKSNISEKFEQRLWVSLELSSNCKNKGPAISGSPKQTTTAVHTHKHTLTPTPTPTRALDALPGQR